MILAALVRDKYCANVASRRHIRSCMGTLTSVTEGMDLITAIRAGTAKPPAGIATLGLDVTHHWIDELTPGHVAMTWPVDPAYANLEGATICVWLAALGDQALFFATRSLCNDGEETRMLDFSLQCPRPVESGSLTLRAEATRRKDGSSFDGVCVMTLDDSSEAARMTAIISIIR